MVLYVCQFFYVAEICQHLNPGSAFPDDHFRTFTEYYESKYGIRIQNQTQPLLDVDHTSARLNLLTPRSVPPQPAHGQVRSTSTCPRPGQFRLNLLTPRSDPPQPAHA